MIIEIPDPEYFLGVIIAFLSGLLILYGYTKIHSLIKNERHTQSEIDRLDYYEKQLIDLKIKLDTININNLGTKFEKINELPTNKKSAVPNEINQPDVELRPPQPSVVSRMPNMDQNNATQYVLGLITDKSMTSRDIQITIGRTREHTSRLMKKLFEDGLVQRNTKTKPYTYSLTEKGMARISIPEKLIQVPKTA